ncbi:cbb3-type cytochrome c oxidase N-terminal domain-containing protein [Pseudochryseolinea flava]|uniref:Cytochrome oxidase subunit III n=1 Tax=Pseudochryseolinea flava TaxID=2059302 RepID=A0A364Y6B3_9BACT|nr:cbb3-type cytochrome c oxidase N-terminal domain-containing protein [Pseudochryseolinea flava]RAW02382.1 cytochrome oxidase subunit III [Pseudochryseolinea flava]
MKKICFGILMMMMTATTSFAGDAVKSFKQDPFSHPHFALYVVLIMFIITIVLVSIAILYVVKTLNMFTADAEREKALKLGNTYVPRPSFWARLSQKMNASVPVADERSIEMHHSYDGIKELDNHLPPWWTYLFYGTIAWSVIYIVVFHLSDSLPLQTEEYESELVVAEQQAQRLRASQPQEQIDVEKLVYNADAKLIENGKAVFVDNNCGACHRGDGGGNTIGPNLTDEYWLHGGQAKEIFTTIKAGVIDKGMPAWGKSLSPQKVRDVTFFIMSLQGSKPENGKAPQGEKVIQAAPSDTLRSAAL